MEANPHFVLTNDT